MRNVCANPGREQVSSRFISLFLASALVASVFYSFIQPSTAHAAEAQRNGSVVTYEGKTFSPPDSTTPLPSGISDAYVSRSADGATVSFLLFNGDPATANGARYVTYDFSPPNQYTNPQEGEAATIVDGDAQTNASGNQTANTTRTESCTVTPGIGYILCPITRFFANSMDSLFMVLVEFLEVRPVQSSTDNALFRMWVVMRDIANVAFVAVFIFIILSQVSTIGISNYGIKKSLPRLVIAAVLVNTSYWICALAVDMSNFVGYSLYDLMMGIYQRLVTTPYNSDLWSNLASTVLMGGAGATGIAIYGKMVLFGSMGGAGSAVYLLIPVLVGLLIAILVALLVLAARQAVITVAIILSPLAFVAYVLPNTEKFFEKWKDLFMTMLLLFPIFAVIFAGAQLAGLAIIQNASSLNVAIFGLAVQVAPVVITPLLVKFSGSLLGKIAGLVNNPKTGILDRTKGWANGRAELSKARVLAGKGKNNWMNRNVQKYDRKQRERERFKKDYGTMADNRFEESWHKRANRTPSLMEHEAEVRRSTDTSQVWKNRIESNYEELKSGHNTSGVSAATVYGVKSSAEALSLEAIRKHQAEDAYQQHLNDALMSNTQFIQGKRVEDYAAGIGNKPSVRAAIIAKDRKDFDEKSNAQNELMKHYKVNGEQIEKLAMGRENVEIVDEATGKVVHTFHIDDDYTRDAATAQIYNVGSHDQKMAVAMETGKGGVNYKYRATIQSAIIKTGFGKSAPALNDKALDDMINGKFLGEHSWDFHSLRQIAEGRLKAETIAGTNQKSLKKMFEITKNPNFNSLMAELKPEARADFAENFDVLKQQVERILDTSNMRQNPTAEAIKEMNLFVGRPANDKGR